MHHAHVAPPMAAANPVAAREEASHVSGSSTPCTTAKLDVLPSHNLTTLQRVRSVCG